MIPCENYVFIEEKPHFTWGHVLRATSIYAKIH